MMYADDTEDYCLVEIANETVYFLILDDKLVEGHEVLYITLVLNSNNTRAVIENDTISVVIYDNDGTLVLILDCRSDIYPHNVRCCM